MAGLRVPVVLFPRYSTFLGPMAFPTAFIPVAAYSSIYLEFWHGPITGGAPITITFDESNDAQDLTSCGGGPWSIPMGSGQSPLSASLSKAWLRATLILAGGPSSGVTCYAQGFFELREK